MKKLKEGRLLTNTKKPSYNKPKVNPAPHKPQSTTEESEPKQSKTRIFGGKDDKTFWSDKQLQPGHPDFDN